MYFNLIKYTFLFIIYISNNKVSELRKFSSVKYYLCRNNASCAVFGDIIQLKILFFLTRQSCTNSDVIFINLEFETRIWVIFKRFQHFKFKIISNVQLELNYIRARVMGSFVTWLARRRLCTMVEAPTLMHFLHLTRVECSMLKMYSIHCLSQFQSW